MPQTIAKPGIKGTYGTMYYVKDMAKSTAWFKKQVGLKPTYESADWTEFGLEGHSLCLHKMSGEPEATQLILRVEGIKRMAEDMKAKGIKFRTEVHEVHPGAYAATFIDPDGNLIGLYEGPKSN